MSNILLELLFSGLIICVLLISHYTILKKDEKKAEQDNKPYNEVNGYILPTIEEILQLDKFLISYSQYHCTFYIDDDRYVINRESNTINFRGVLVGESYKYCSLVSYTIIDMFNKEVARQDKETLAKLKRAR